MGSGLGMMIAVSFSMLAPAAFGIVFVGACAGTAYVTGFTVLQETVADDLRGRIFATLYTVIRMCLLVALVVSPLFADFWDWVVNDLGGVGTVTVGRVEYSFPGVRIALWCGGIITLLAGLYARRSMKRAGPDPRTGGTASGAVA